MSHESGPNPNHPSSSELSSIKTSEDNNGSASSRLSVAGTLSTATKPPAMIDEHDIEDGPLFRATITELEGRTSTLKTKVKRILKSALASLEAKRISLEADEEFVRALRDVSTVDPLFKYYLDDAWPKMFEQRERLLHSMQSLLIDPLRKLYEMDIKMADTKRRQFEDVSKDYYASLAKYLSLKTDSSKRQDSEAKHVAKQRHFDLVRFNYYAFLVDLHGGKKEQEILYHLLSYQQKEYAFYQSVASTLTPSKTGLDDLATMMADISREQNIVNKERYEKRKMLESKVAEAGSNIPSASVSLQKKAPSLDQRSSSEITGSIMPPSNTVTAREDTTATDVLSASSDDEASVDKFRGYRDLQQQNRELLDTGRRKEGFLFAVSKPSKNVAVDKSSASTWHKYWCVLVGGQLHEYSNWKGQLQRHIEPINLKFATAREARSADRRFCFEVITRDFRRVYQATSQEEMQSWIATINNAIQSILNGYGSAVDLNKGIENAENEPTPEPSTSKKKDRGKSLRGALRSGLAREKYLKKRHSHSGIESAERLASLAAAATSAAEAKLKWPGLNFGKHGASNPKQSQHHTFAEAADINTELLSTLRKDPSNTTCADCGAANPDWCSLNLGILLCIECSGIHRSLGTHISKVRSLTLDSTSYTPDIIALLRAIGNARANAVWAANCNDSTIKPSDTREVKLKHIQAKYVERAFIEQLPDDLGPQQLLFHAVDNDDIPAALYAVAVGANVNAARPSSSSPKIYLLNDDEEGDFDWRESKVSSSRVSHTTAATMSDTQSTNGIDIEGIKADLDASYYTVRYPLHFALLHGRVTIDSPERRHVYPMAEFLLQNGADASIRDPATGCLLSELVGLGSLVEDEALEYVNTKIAARGQAQIARSSMPPPPVHFINNSSNNSSSNSHTS